MSPWHDIVSDIAYAIELGDIARTSRGLCLVAYLSKRFMLPMDVAMRFHELLGRADEKGFGPGLFEENRKNLTEPGVLM